MSKLENIINNILDEDYVNLKATSNFKTSDDIRELNRLPMNDIDDGLEYASRQVLKQYGDILYRLPLNIVFGYATKDGKFETFRKQNDDFYLLTSARYGARVKDERIHYTTVAKYLASRRGWATGVIRVMS